MSAALLLQLALRFALVIRARATFGTASHALARLYYLGDREHALALLATFAFARTAHSSRAMAVPLSRTDYRLLL